MSDQPIIRIRGVERIYSRGGEDLHVLQGLDLDIEDGKFYALMGPSGSGKTTLLNLIGGLDSPDGGTIEVAGEHVEELDGADLSQWRAEHVGFVFQGFNLLSVLTAFENVMLPLNLTPLKGSQKKEQAKRALELVGLKERMGHRPSQLSGGQEQRVAIARAIATDPTLLLADEPTGDLDRDTAEQILDLMQELNRKLGKTILMVTHDPVAAEFADAVIHLDKGLLGRIEHHEKPRRASFRNDTDESTQEAPATAG